MQTLIFTLSVFLSAFLLFVVQPMFARMLLPLLGGSASVWTTCMLVFQALLLLGYIYAHVTTRLLSLTRQIAVHLLLMLSVMWFLPFFIQNQLTPDENPAIQVVVLAAFSIGVPFFVISTTAPLLQRWFSFTDHPRRDNPYFLYAASNLGSMLALLSYPFLIERYFGVQAQTIGWRYLFWGLCGLFIGCSALLLKGKQSPAAPGQVTSTSEPPEWSTKVVWVIYAFIPSSLMLGLTSFITTDIASISLFWVVPLALYLLTFIITFGCDRQPTVKLFVLPILALISILLLSMFAIDIGKLTSTLLHVLLFFSLSWFFHSRLAESKPQPEYLTGFFIWLAVGGMLGGVFNALIAPVLFKRSFEYFLVLIMGLSILQQLALKRGSNNDFFVSQLIGRIFALFYALKLVDIVFSKPVSSQPILLYWVAFLLTVALLYLSYRRRLISGLYFTLFSALLVISGIGIPRLTHPTLIQERSFFGSMTVKYSELGNHLIHNFYHGTTLHGFQVRTPLRMQSQVLSYYHPSGGFGDIAASYINNRSEALRIGVLGLGSGVQACYGKEKDSVIFFEIDQKVVDIAKNPDYFSFLEHCPAEVIVGDGRFALQAQPNASFDLLFMDAFSSDSVPTHLLTQEAFNSYLPKLKQNGVLVIHISNRYLDLKRVVAAYNLPSGYVGYYFPLYRTEEKFYSPHIVSIFTRDQNISPLIRNSERWRRLEQEVSYKPWTDDHTNLFSVVENLW